MNKFNKIKNINSVNLLTEKLYLESKELTESWKTNVAAGLATVAGGVTANAQSSNSVDTNQLANSIKQQASDKVSGSNTANPFGTDNSLAFQRTRPIVDIQYGVQDGKTGNDSMYLYHKDRNAPDFNPKNDRTTVFMKNKDNLVKTIEYQNYMKSLQSKNTNARVAAVDETEKVIKENFAKIFNSIKRLDENELK